MTANPPRILVVVPPFTGHINPTLGVGQALLRMGYRVAWTGFRLPTLPRGAESFTLNSDDPQGLASGVLEDGAQLRGLRSVKFFYEEVLVPLTRAMLPKVERVVELWRPDLLLVDQQALAGAFAARRAGLPWVSSCTTSASVVEPLAEFPKIIGWRDELMADLQREVGLPVERRPGLSPQGQIVFSSAALIGHELPDHVHCVGPVLTARPPVEFPWDRLDPKRRKVLISLGTVSGDRGDAFYAAVADAFSRLDAQGILVAPADRVPELPDNLLRFDFVPQLDVLRHVDAVVSHGGHNTVVESLAAGRPLVLAPIRDDQPVVASQVVAAGAGVRVKFGRIRGPRLEEALRTVLDDPSYRAAAERVGATLRNAGGAEAAARVISALVPSVAPAVPL